MSTRPVVGITEKNRDEYWSFVNAGWAHAADRLGLQLRIDAPEFEDVEQQRSLMRRQLADGVDALAFVATRSDGFDDIVAEARSAGVPSVAFDLDAPGSERVLFVGMENPRDAGRRLAQRMLADGIGSGSVFLQNGSAAAPGARGKRDGIVEVLTEAGIAVVESEPDGEDRAKARRIAAEGVATTDDLVAAVGVYGYHPEVLAGAIGGSGVPIYGYDLLPATIELIESGIVRGVVWIREIDFGVHAAAAVSDILRLGEQTALEIRGMDPGDRHANQKVPPPLYVTGENLDVARERYRALSSSVRR